jgi:uracil phosphoribosyltransferase
MNLIETIASEDADLLLNSVRNAGSDSSVVRDSLRRLGEIAGLRIARKWFSANKEFMTPMSQPVSGVVQEAVNVCVVSTSDEYAVFGAGIASCFRGCLRGQLDFHGRRGAEALRGPVNSYKLPQKRGDLDAVVVAKSVLATGCTAIRLLDDAQKEYTPKHLIVATVFFSERGVQEVRERYPHLDIVAFGQPDSLNADGMLIPGVGNIDRRSAPGPTSWRRRLVEKVAWVLGVEL